MSLATIQAPDVPAAGAMQPAPLEAAVRQLSEMHVALTERVAELERALSAARAAHRVDDLPSPGFERAGDVWRVTFAGEQHWFADSKGMRYLAHLVASPGAEVHALELVAGGAAPQTLRALAASGSAELLDAEARSAYRSRLAELHEELRAARRFNDPERAARLQVEVDFLVGELERAVGLGGRARRQPSPAERARQSATKAIKAARERIAQESPALADHLERTVRTGTHLSYVPALASWPAAGEAASRS